MEGLFIAITPDNSTTEFAIWHVLVTNNEGIFENVADKVSFQCILQF